MALGFLTTGAFEDSKAERPSVVDLALTALSIAVGAYFAFHAERIVERNVLLDPLTNADLFFATAVFLLTLEVTRRTTGLGLLAIVLIFVAYNLWGDRLDGVLQHGEIGFQHFLEITVFTTDGIFGLPVRVAATYAFMFVLFGTLLEACGGGKFFFDFAEARFEHDHAGAQSLDFLGVRGLAGGERGEVVGAVRAVGGHEPVVGGEQVAHDDHECSGHAELGQQGRVHAPPSWVVRGPGRLRAGAVRVHRGSGVDRVSGLGLWVGLGWWWRGG